MPQGSADAVNGRPDSNAMLKSNRLVSVERPNSRFMLGLRQFDMNLNATLAIVFTIANPDLTKILPIVSAALNREPRPGHKVDALQSQTGPQVIEPDAFYRTARHQRLDAIGVHVKDMASIKGDFRGR
jgi:hypothetical protein